MGSNKEVRSEKLKAGSKNKRCYGREEINKRQDSFEASKDGPRSTARANNECHLSGDHGNPDSLIGLECFW
jgi:hypothetical protein